ncbi:MAG: hypothetical protein IIZ36_00605, partial [Ruminococcus sp.]|nr:hypothetical protein [Ruminococcus sp.]
CRTNDVYEAASLDGTQFALSSIYTLYDKFFLLSMPEITGIYDRSTIKDGELLDYYRGLSTAERIHRDKNSSARGCFTRSPRAGFARLVHYLNSVGDMYYWHAGSDLGVTPACIIA